MYICIKSLKTCLEIRQSQFTFHPFDWLTAPRVFIMHLSVTAAHFEYQIICFCSIPGWVASKEPFKSNHIHVQSLPEFGTSNQIKKILSKPVQRVTIIGLALNST